MSEARQSIRGVIDGRASRLAFRIGQSVERALMDRAVRCTAAETPSDGRVVVSVDHVRHVLDGSLLVEACGAVGIVIDGETRDQPQNAIAG
jgi:hypothetical protein